MVFFFFSSRRRHTRCLSDWSSDVCSSDLSWGCGFSRRHARRLQPQPQLRPRPRSRGAQGPRPKDQPAPARSEERRVGKECRSRWSTDHIEKKENKQIGKRLLHKEKS